MRPLRLSRFKAKGRIRASWPSLLASSRGSHLLIAAGRGDPRADAGRFIGVKDISAVRLSLPAQLCEPMGNLEYVPDEGSGADCRYWGYLDRPDYFARYPG
jgi:hypothetical protein